MPVVSAAFIATIAGVARAQEPAEQASDEPTNEPSSAPTAPALRPRTTPREALDYDGREDASDAAEAKMRVPCSLV